MKTIFKMICLLFVWITTAQADKLIVGTYSYIAKYIGAEQSFPITFKWCYRTNDESQRQGSLYTSYGVISNQLFNTNGLAYSSYPKYAIINAVGTDSRGKTYSLIMPQQDKALQQTEIQKMLDEAGVSTAMSSAPPLLINIDKINLKSRAPIMEKSSIKVISQVATQSNQDAIDDECVAQVGKLLSPPNPEECKTPAGKSGSKDDKDCVVS